MGKQSKSRGHSARRKGRPKGPERVSFALRLLPEQKRDLEILSSIMEGVPPLNSLIQVAISRYVSEKLEDRALRRKYESLLNPRLSMLG